MKTTEEVFEEVLKELGFDGYKPSQMTNSDYWMCTNTAMKRFAESYYQSKIDAVTDDRKKWSNRCKLAERFIKESPCDPDINDEQIKWHTKWQSFIKNNFKN